jgi:seryl-tRNA synthetase
MLDIKLFREKPDLIRESERKRFRDTANVDKVIEYDIKWRETLQELNSLRRERNNLSKSFKEAKSQGKAKVEEIKRQSKNLGDRIAKLGPQIDDFLQKRDQYRYEVGNLLDESVPLSESEEDNLILREVGELPSFNFEPFNHVDLIRSVDGVNMEKASEIAGSRSYYLKADLVYLNLALMKFAIDMLAERGFTPFQTPFFLKHEVVKEAAELADFEDMLYKVEGEDLFMIATSEQTLAALHRNEILGEGTLPRRYCGVSSCFRREAGSHGRDTLGIFRVHQFEKVEQFVFCKAEESKSIHEELIKNAEIIYQKLEIPYRIVSIVSSALNDNASLKYDLEAWFPGSNTYRELVSCTNCLDYQARKLKARYGTHGDSGSINFCHTINSTAIATERTICCILENYQQEDGTVKVPEVLVPYMNGKTVMGKWE